jgi:hypothetical protein
MSSNADPLETVIQGFSNHSLMRHIRAETAIRGSLDAKCRGEKVLTAVPDDSLIYSDPLLILLSKKGTPVSNG